MTYPIKIKKNPQKSNNNAILCNKNSNNISKTILKSENKFQDIINEFCLLDRKSNTYSATIAHNPYTFSGCYKQIKKDYK